MARISAATEETEEPETSPLPRAALDSEYDLLLRCKRLYEDKLRILQARMLAATLATPPRNPLLTACVARRRRKRIYA